MGKKTSRKASPILPFRSKFEEKVAQYLEDRGVNYGYELYEYEYEAPLRKNKAWCADCGGTTLVRTGWYTPDFFLPNGIIVEAKGRFTAENRRKMLAVREAHPNETFVLLFQRNNRIHKRSETRYSDWCESNNFDYSIGVPKDEWLYETK